MAKWRRDELYRQQARVGGYRSRAAFKLIEIENRFQIFEGVQKVVDLCSAPGSWLQVATQFCEIPPCSIIGVDMTYIRPIKGVQIIQSSIDSPTLASQILNGLGGRAHIVLSDCAPKLTGNKTVDRERQLWQAQLCLKIATKILNLNGHFVTKIFLSKQFRDFENQVKQNFQFVKPFKPKASFRKSPEMYLIAKNFKAHPIIRPEAGP